MKFTAALALAASALFGTVAAQPEATRFGVVNITPVDTKFKPSYSFEVHYNSTLSPYQPKYLDFYIQGTLSSGYVLPQYLLERVNYNSDQNTYYLKTLFPDIEPSDPHKGYNPDASYLVWAYITYPIGDPAYPAYEYGGTSAPIAIDYS